MHTNSSCGINSVGLEIKKNRERIGFFKRLRNKFSKLNSINIYNTMLKPHFEYGSTILYKCCSKQQLKRLQKLQNKALRSILRLNRFTPIIIRCTKMV